MEELDEPGGLKCEELDLLVGLKHALGKQGGLVDYQANMRHGETASMKEHHTVTVHGVRGDHISGLVDYFENAYRSGVDPSVALAALGYDARTDEDSFSSDVDPSGVLAALGYDVVKDADVGEMVFLHGPTGSRVWCEAMDLTCDSEEPFDVIFHYTTLQGFAAITHVANDATEIWATLMHQTGASGVLDAFYGSGIYGTRRDPAWFGSTIAILYNNYYGAILMKRQKEIEQRTPCTMYVIPLLVNRSNLIDVKTQVAPELKALGIESPGIDRHGKPMFEHDKLRKHLEEMPDDYTEKLQCLFAHGRDVVVVQLHSEDKASIVNARSKRAEVIRKRLASASCSKEMLESSSLHLARLERARGHLAEATQLLAGLEMSTYVDIGARPAFISKVNLDYAEVLRDQGRSDECDSKYHQAMGICRAMGCIFADRRIGGEDEPTVTSIGKYAAFLHEEGRLDEAEPLFREALECYRTEFCTNQKSADRSKNTRTLNEISDFAHLLHLQGCLDEAEPLLREVLNGRRTKFGAKYPDTLTALSNLARLLYDQGRLSEAEPLFLEALTARREKLGAKHPDTLTDINALGLLMQSQGRFDKAELLLHEALQGRRETLGDKHKHTIASISDFAKLLYDQERFLEAETFGFEALKGYLEKFGADNRYTERCLRNVKMIAFKRGSTDATTKMAEVLHAAGRTYESEMFFHEALKMCQQEYDVNHTYALIRFVKWASWLRDQGRKEESAAIVCEVLEGCYRMDRAKRERAGDPDSVTVLAKLLMDQGCADDAEPLLRRALDDLREKHGASHPTTISFTQNLAAMLFAQGRFQEAEPLCREVLEYFRQVFGDQHFSTLKCMGWLAAVLEPLGRSDEVLNLRIEQWVLSKKSLGDEDPYTKQLHSNLLAQLPFMSSSGHADLFHKLVSSASSSRHCHSLKCGAKVRIHGLQSASGSKLNGTVGQCLEFIASSGRWGVRLSDGTSKALKPENLSVVSADCIRM